nr:MAG TPA: hypothetical protein [Caudoviricetes sp.]
MDSPIKNKRAWAIACAFLCCYKNQHFFTFFEKGY